MTDAELEADWPDLGIVVRELRALNRAELGVGATLDEHRAVRKTLSIEGSAAWDRVIDRIERIYGGINLGHWLARQWRRLRRTK